MPVESEPLHTMVRALLRQIPRRLHARLDDQLRNLPARYFHALDIDGLCFDLNLIERAETDGAFALISEAAGRHVLRVAVAHDQPRVFLRIVALLARHGISIEKASIYTGCNNDLVLDHFAIAAGTSRAAMDAAVEDICAALHTGEFVPPQVPPPEGRGLLVVFNNHSSPEFTTVSVEASDQLGFLYRVASVFDSLNVQLAHADIKTRHGRISDTFQISSTDEQKLSAEEATHLRDALLLAFQ